MGVDDQNKQSLIEDIETFFHDFFVRGQKLVRGLIEENTRLRLNQETGQTRNSQTDVVQNLADRISSLEDEYSDIQRSSSLTQESQHLADILDSLEREHYQLADLYFASNQFHAASTIDDVARTVQEILLNFIGVGRFTIFCVDEERETLFPLLREGGDITHTDELPLQDSGPIAEVLAQKASWRKGDPLGESADNLGYLPLVCGTRVVGLVRLEEFLPQKDAFTDTDYGLLEVISEHAGIGIENAWMRAHAKEVPLNRNSIERLVRA